MNHFWNLIQKFYITPLIMASYEDHIEIVKLLLAQPSIEINCKDILTQKHS